ncbi:cytochrome P450 [Mycena sp. CBHHK59/15]|nr:cytochrome P450 [Mycena sp. CBHHK59/15]
MQYSEIFVLGSLLFWTVAFLLRLGRREQGLPPGPPTVPLLGNAHLLREAAGDLHLKLTEWAREYGDIFSLKVGSGTMVVLSSATAIKEVVDKHAWAGSSRPGNYIAELSGSSGEYNVLFTTDCSRLRNLRRMLARFFSPQNSLKYVPVQAAESTVLLHDLMTHPSDFSHSIRRYTHSLAKIFTYGQRAPSFHSDEVQQFYTSLDQLVHSIAPGVYPPFDMLPVLKYLPKPLAPWRAVCDQIGATRTALHTKLYRDTARWRAEGDLPECFIGKVQEMDVLLEEKTFYSSVPPPLYLTYTGISLLDAGSDTTGAFLLSLVLVLAAYPECQARAREEIDAVVGNTRLPELEDFTRMPYVGGLINETLRFPAAVSDGRSAPHDGLHAIQYKDYVVPKDTVVVLNTHALYHDPDVFEHPEVFNPDRFLQSKHGTRPGMDIDFRDNFLFGGGRQLTTMRLIWALEFGPPTDPKTNESISRELCHYSSDFVVMPRPFKCAIQPRSREHQEVVVQAFEDVQLLLSRYEGK